MINREISKYVLRLAKKLPVLTITGPRQSGKTTLVKKLFQKKAYLNLELPDVREFALSDPRGFLNQIPEGGIIDEIQRVPNLVSYIQGIVDEKKTNGMFILTGSQQLEISNTINQSLAGRTTLIKLLPFSLAEVTSNYKVYETNRLLINGFFPRIYDQNLNPTKTLADYLETYIERDLRQLIQVKNLSQFQKFVKLCAGRVGQLLNLNNMANDIGVSHTTIREWLTLLEASYVVFLLQPFYANIKKRLIKAPKLYFYDVGMASYLLGIENEKHIQSHPLRGNLFENMVVIEILKYRFNQARQNNLNFYRDSNGNELDIMYNIADKYMPIEIKAGQTFNSDYIKGIRSFEKVFGDLPLGGVVLYDGALDQTRKNILIKNYSKISRLLKNAEKKYM